VLCEEFIDGIELTCPVLGQGATARALPVVRIDAPEGKYDFQNKYYTDDTVKYRMPQRPERGRRSRGAAPDAGRLPRAGLPRLGPRRPDAARGPQIFLLEMNTSPGHDRPFAGAHVGPRRRPELRSAVPAPAAARQPGFGPRLICTMARNAHPPTPPWRRAALPLPADVRLMNTVASTVFVLAGWARWPRGAVADALAGVPDPQHPARRRPGAQQRAHACAPMRRRGWPATSSAPTCSRAAPPSRPCPGCAAPSCAASGPTAWWCSWKNTAPWRCGRAKTVPTAGQQLWRSLRSQRGRRRRRGLPVLSGPEGSAAQMLTLYRRLLPALRPLDMGSMQLHLSGRGSWRVLLDSGATLELGRGSEDELLARTERFVRTLASVTAAGKRRWNTPTCATPTVMPCGCAASPPPAATRRPSAEGKDQLEEPPWPKNSRTWSSRWTSAPPR
jgi:cell division protein FtsQ